MSEEVSDDISLFESVNEVDENDECVYNWVLYRENYLNDFYDNMHDDKTIGDVVSMISTCREMMNHQKAEIILILTCDVRIVKAKNRMELESIIDKIAAMINFKKYEDIENYLLGEK